MSTPTTYPPRTPPLNLRSFRFSTQLDPPPLPRNTKSSDILSSKRSNKVVTSSNNGDIGHREQRVVKGKTSGDSAGSSSGYDDPFASHFTAASSFTSYEHSPRDSIPPTAQPNGQVESDRKRNRGSLLIVASDAISFLGRRRKFSRQPPMPIMLPEVIEISAHRRDEEVEERERLRDAAAQSIGLGPVLLQVSHMGGNHSDEGDDDLLLDEVRTIEPNLYPGKSVHDSSLSAIQSSQPFHTRSRQGSVGQMGHTRSGSTPPLVLPLFPTTISALTPVIHASSTLPKYYPSSSLRIFTLSKQWKSRHMVLSVPAPSPTRASAPAASYLHLFKSPGAEEKEVERLEINEDSIVFVAEEEVSGRRNVVKVGGLDVGALKKELNHEEAGRTMWLLQIVDSTEAQKWIAAIKNAILSQRSMRAGLGYAAPTMSGVEPRGDMDVMLSMRAQGIIASPTSPKFHLPEVATPTQFNPNPEQTYASSVSSHSVRSQGVVHKSASTGAVSTLKGLFSNAARPRSSSRAASLDHERFERETHDDTFPQNRGNNLLTLLRSSGNPDSGFPLTPTAPSSTAYGAPDPSFYAAVVTKSSLDRKIVQEPEHWSQSKSEDKTTRLQPHDSLQPPPRKRPWTYTPGKTTSSVADSGMYNHTNGNASIAGSFGVGMSHDTDIKAPSSPAPTGNSFGSPARERAPSLYSVSTFASVEPPERRVSGSKRRSRQVTIPRRPTPPNGPIPSVPGPQQHDSALSLAPAQSTTEEQPRSRTTSAHSVISAKNLVASLPSFSKRGSVGSSTSLSTGSASHHSVDSSLSPQQQQQQQQPSSSPVNSRPSPLRLISAHRTSVPPPQRPAPNFAPPPAPPLQETRLPESPPATKTSFRDSAMHRTVRLSLMAPKPPPSIGLPPRPDERHHFNPMLHMTRSFSQADTPTPTPSTSFFVVPGFTRSTSPPFPPPDGPLPPRPSSPPAARRPTLKQRLRILSAPSPSVTSPSLTHDTMMRERPSTMTAFAPPLSTPPAAIGERIITNMQNDPSFLTFQASPSATVTPLDETSPSIMPISIPHRRSPDAHIFAGTPDSLSSSPELTSLSPPPRRGSRQLFQDELVQNATPYECVVQENRVLTPQTSVHSLGLVSTRSAL